MSVKKELFMTNLLDGRIVVITGDIANMKVDAIVNAANSSLLGGGGVDGAIHRRGGSEILAECRQIRSGRYTEGLPTGEAVVTGAGKLPCRFVIHTVGPVWRGGNSGEAEKLGSCYTRTLEEARQHRLETLAFPAISTGVYGYPKQEAAGIAYSAVRDFLERSQLPETVTFVFFSAGDADLFLNAIR
jgi:O-acetyl-ADP-ribose deacetylase (regulator of RNase III)